MGQKIKSKYNNKHQIKRILVFLLQIRIHAVFRKTKSYALVYYNSFFFIVVLILWNTYNFFQIFKKTKNEQNGILASAFKTLLMLMKITDIELPLSNYPKNTTIPMIVTDTDEDSIKVIILIIR